METEKITLNSVLESLERKLVDVGHVAQTKVLPGPRGRLMMALTDVNMLVKAIQELAQRSGAGHRLGFIKTDKGLRPAAAPERPDDNALNNELSNPAIAAPSL